MSLFLPKAEGRQQAGLDPKLSSCMATRQPRPAPFFRTTPSATSGTQLWSETAPSRDVRYLVSARRSLRAEALRRCPRSSRSSSASAPSEATASATRSRTSASSSFTPQRPAAGLAHGCPVPYPKSTDLPSAFFYLLERDAPLCGREKVASLFGGAAGTAAAQQLPGPGCTPDPFPHLAFQRSTYCSSAPVATRTGTS